MGFFNFHKKTELLAPMTGRVIPLEKVPDAVFSQKTLGEGAAIMPEDGLVTAPCDPCGNRHRFHTGGGL